jgi:S1-C subfamily serine protease
VVPQLIARGQVQRPDLGFDPLPESWSSYFDGPKGVAVMRVHRGGPAQAAGLEGLTRNGRNWVLGDVITGINGQPVQTYDRLLDLVENEPLGSMVKLDIQRGNRRLRLDLRLQPASP